MKQIVPVIQRHNNRITQVKTIDIAGDGLFRVTHQLATTLAKNTQLLSQLGVLTERDRGLRASSILIHIRFCQSLPNSI